MTSCNKFNSGGTFCPLSSLSLSPRVQVSASLEQLSSLCFNFSPLRTPAHWIWQRWAHRLYIVLLPDLMHRLVRIVFPPSPSFHTKTKTLTLKKVSAGCCILFFAYAQFPVGFRGHTGPATAQTLQLTHDGTAQAPPHPRTPMMWRVESNHQGAQKRSVRVACIHPADEEQAAAGRQQADSSRAAATSSVGLSFFSRLRYSCYV
jgi:hypothetical protein